MTLEDFVQGICFGKFQLSWTGELFEAKASDWFILTDPGSKSLDNYSSISCSYHSPTGINDVCMALRQSISKILGYYMLLIFLIYAIYCVYIVNKVWECTGIIGQWLSHIIQL